MVVATEIASSSRIFRTDNFTELLDKINDDKVAFDISVMLICKDLYTAAVNLKHDECDRLARKLSDKMFECRISDVENQILDMKKQKDA